MIVPGRGVGRIAVVERLGYRASLLGNRAARRGRRESQTASRSSAPCRIQAGRQLVHRPGAADPGAVGLRDQHAVHRRAGKPFVPEPRSAGRAVEARCRAKARADWQRGPSVPSMLIGRPITKPAAPRVSINPNRVSDVDGELAALDQGERAGDHPGPVGHRDADRLAAEIEADKRRVFGDTPSVGLQCRQLPSSALLPALYSCQTGEGARNPCALH